MNNNVIKIGNIAIGEGTINAESFSVLLAAADTSDTLYVDFHSEGGGVFDGFAIYNQLKEWPGKKVARVKAAAFSIASYIAMACDEVEIADNGFFMIHNPWTETTGDDAAHAKSGELLAELKESMIGAYSKKTGMDAAMVQSLMNAESYIGAKRAVELGLADRVIEPAPPTNQPKSQLPQAVYAVMYPQPSGTNADKKDVIMSTAKVAATVKTIKSAFPKASTEFIVRCMEEEMSMEEVTEENAKAMEEENEELKAKVAAMEEEIAALKAKAMEDEDEMAKAMEEEEEIAALVKAKRTGVKPIASVPSGSNKKSALEQWQSLVDRFKAKGHKGSRAAILANKANPGLRSQIVEEANA